MFPVNAAIFLQIFRWFSALEASAIEIAVKIIGNGILNNKYIYRYG